LKILSSISRRYLPRKIMPVINGVSKVNDESKFYDDAKTYWDKIPATIDGMMGSGINILICL
jgi:hypothetical protein